LRIRPREFLVDEDAKVRLKRWPTRVEPYYRSKAHYEKLLAEQLDELRKLQDRHYAYHRYALLAIFQAMDAAGKDGAIKHVMSGLNPQGVQVVSFKHPSATELEHDFLWRAALYLPARGRIGIFNRSYYEEVLIVRVHREILEKEDLPEERITDQGIWQDRYRSIRHFERHLHHNGTRIVKFFLHLSREEQRKRFLARIDDPDKNWKLSLADIEERKYWPQYMKAYEACLAATSTRRAPWYVVPADDKENARLIVSAIIRDVFKRLGVRYPETTPERKRELRAIRRQLAR
jgi:PPK2 family polyphosphate:nucleotide phosphotransferase